MELSKGRVEAKSALPSTKIQEQDTEKVLSYVGLKSERDALEKGLLLGLIETYENQGRITEEQIGTTNRRFDARLSYKQAA